MSDELHEAHITKGIAFANQWLMPLRPKIAELRSGGHDDLEWAIPARLWDPEFLGKPDTPPPSMFWGLPIVLDGSITEPTVRVSGE